MIPIRFAAGDLPKHGVLAVPILDGAALGSAASDLDRVTGGQISRALKVSGGELKRGDILDVLAPANTGLDRIVLFGLGKTADATRLDREKAGAGLAAKVGRLRVASITLGLAGLPADAALDIATGLALRAYRFDKYKTATGEDETPATLADVVLHLGDADGAEGAFASLRGVVESVHATRDLVSEPANVLTPAAFAEACRGLSSLGLEVEVFDRAQLESMGFRTLLAVAQGSAQPPYVAVISWKGGMEGEAPVALVGKGVCFDSGGISIKPAAGMEEMKWDMGGAGAVFGAMRAVAARKARANVVGVLGLVENMPSGTATRPGDVVRSLSGVTIEVINTDAEGRLILADLLWYAKERFKPKAMVNLATLTGAVVVALGNENAGLFANDDALAAQLDGAGRDVAEPLWRLPTGGAYAKHIQSDIADIKNVGRARQAGATAGAVFLQRFVGDVPWAHLDIAATAWSQRDLTFSPKGATGFGVRLLDRLVADHYEAGA
ncbi:leucyl aminopeptidase [Marinivivus vitaminiproducens]|uniref:leucyl aminopeptidase n=1 Tax=Marinivivus vitaminiproducens TaxID=3035935 RepID=UPI0027A86931|nr:leucyl aminopeptidase [Geminicoccaceae bacterium SCSIO 64248]